MTTLTCDRADLAWAIRAVLPHACKDSRLPVLCGIRLEVAPADSTLYLIATDRYSAGCARVAITGDHREFEVTLDRADVGELARKLRGKGKAGLALYDTEIVLDDFYRFRPVSGNYPNVRKLIGDMLRKPPVIPGKEQGIDAAKLARFARARPAGHPLIVMPVRNSTVVVAENFAGIVMHMRGQGTTNLAHLRRWRELIPVEATP